ncbi:MAG: DNA-processing protein DprA [Burkholderiales bacterium]
MLAKTLAWLQAPGRFLVTLQSADYPPALKEINLAPTLLYAMGRRELLVSEKLAVVGSRNPTAQGEKNALAFAQALSEANLTIVSGLALGIDACAHWGALKGHGSTIAVVGTGLDRVYPARNRDLARTLAQDGLLLSEFPLGTPPIAGNFPRRNRILSGLSLGCLVVEAAIGSGSLITAQLAGEQGREVFAIPGSIHSPLSKGCHALIKQGAKLAETANDVLEELGWGTSEPNGEGARRAPLSADDEALLMAVGFDPVDLDSLCDRSGLTVDKLSAQLLQLELAGLIVSLPGGFYQRSG